MSGTLSVRTQIASGKGGRTLWLLKKKEAHHLARTNKEAERKGGGRVPNLI
jgi:hypothetical protein